MDRQGPPTILVNRRSATCGYVEMDSSVTFPINATHSDMVKFSPDSQDYHTVISRLKSILSLLPASNDLANNKSETQNHSKLHGKERFLVQQSAGASQKPTKNLLRGIVLTNLLKHSKC